MSDYDVEVEEILRQLKQEVRERYLEEQWEIPLSRAATLEEVRTKSWVNPHQPIAWPHWPKGIWPKIVALAQKIIRRMLSWYISPLVKEQNRFNAAVVETLEALAQENAQLRARLRTLTANQSEPFSRE